MQQRLTTPLPIWAATLIAVAVGLWSGWTAAHIGQPGYMSDMDQVWFAARAMLEGRDPYALIGPGREFAWDWRFYYPLSAPAVLLPLAWFPVEVARVVIGAGGGAGLAYVLARRQPVALLLFASKSYALNIAFVQWSVLLTLALFVPAVGIIFAVKPTHGGAIAAGYHRWRDVRTAGLAATVPVALAFAFDPGWVPRWLAVLETADHFRPFITFPGGFLLLLAALKWRRWDARLLLALSIVPQTVVQYGALPLLLIPRAWWSQVLLVGCTYLPAFLLAREPFASQGVTTETVGLVTLLTVYAPALVMVLTRPNANSDNGHR